LSMAWVARGDRNGDKEPACHHVWHRASKVRALTERTSARGAAGLGNWGAQALGPRWLIGAIKHPIFEHKRVPTTPHTSGRR
jgi:hypothetical protein